MARTLYAWAAMAGERAEKPIPYPVFSHFSIGAVQTAAPPRGPNQKPRYFSAGAMTKFSYSRILSQNHCFVSKIVMALTSSCTRTK